jgi:BA14K-like protein
MTNKFSTLALGTVLGLSTLAFTGATASAAAMLPLSPAVTGQANAATDGIVQIKHKKNKHRHRHNDGIYLSLPFIIGGAYAANRYYGDDYYDDGYYGYDDGGRMSSRHVRWCLNRYQSYNPRTNTWLAYSGRVHQCRSPYL